jgi:hypothetical protein
MQVKNTLIPPNPLPQRANPGDRINTPIPQKRRNTIKMNPRIPHLPVILSPPKIGHISIRRVILPIHLNPHPGR